MGCRQNVSLGNERSSALERNFAQRVLVPNQGHPRPSVQRGRNTPDDAIVLDLAEATPLGRRRQRNDIGVFRQRWSLGGWCRWWRNRRWRSSRRCLHIQRAAHIRLNVVTDGVRLLDEPNVLGIFLALEELTQQGRTASQTCKKNVSTR